MSGFFGFPFFGQQGGGESHYHSQKEKKDTDTNKLYEILGVDKKATPQQIKKQYFNLVKIHHPDKGGDKEKFKEIQQAYEILSDEDKRAKYDEGGMDAVNGPEFGSGDPFDIMRMFGGGDMEDRKPKIRKYKTIRKALPITLENAYNGDLVKIPNEVQRNCQTCQGQGGKNVQKCDQCKGRGQIERMIQLGPGMYQQLRQQCPVCKGEGRICKEKDKCTDCKGERIRQVKKILEVTIEKGCPDQQVIVEHGQGDEAPGIEAGDIQFVVQIKEHPIFKRKGADLFMTKKITLLEALTGTNFTLTHLDKRVITISTTPLDIISDGDKKVIKNQGMPFYKDPMSHGNLIIEFKVEFPKGQDIQKPNIIEQLKKILPGPEIQPLDKDQKFEYMEDFHPDETNTREEGGHGKQDEEDEEYANGHGGQRVQCNSQ